MKNKLFLLGLSGLVAASPAHATAGLLCQTTDGPSRTFSFWSGHHPVAMWAGREKVGADWVEIEVGQQWTDASSLYIDIIDSERLERSARIKTHRDADLYWRGMLITEAGEQPIRCEES